MARTGISRRLAHSAHARPVALSFIVVLAALTAVACSSATIIDNPGQGGSVGGGGGGGGSTSTASGAGGVIIILTSPDASGIDRPGGGSCGDGTIERNEGCDDGNTISGDGCSRICQVENNYDCPTAGQPCVSIAVCGNKLLTSNETCDDGNTVGNDGCSADCMTVEKGWQCRVPGKPCTPKCGDGVISGTETCDDGNTASDDGCSPTCHLEVGWKCDGSPTKCSKTTCGDSKKEGGEGCDDGNSVPFDGCSQECQIEPDCTGTSCTSKCGDGIVLAEDCDDGNAASGDGCSKDCKKEPGWTCTQPDLGDKMMVPVIYRDFKYHSPSDFQASVTGSEAASTGMVNDTLDKDGKPVYSGLQGNAVKVESTTTFGQWYRDTQGVNHSTASKLGLWANGKGAYVNRYGADGQQWNITETAYYCGNVGQELKDASGAAIPCTSQYETTSPTECTTKKAKGEEMLKCYVDGNSYKATFIVEKVDGNPLFFPVDGDTTITPKTEFEGAQIPPFYDTIGKSWPFELDAAGNKVLHNFSFTSEVRYWFKFDSSKSYNLDFVGDDDVWVFINKKLAVDLGGVHTPVQGSLTLDAASAKKLGLENGKVYEAAVFQAERQTTSSTYKLTLSGFNAAPTSCVPTCGDGVTVADEECDNGKDNSDDIYGGCSTKCTWGTFCGDGITNGPEECDNGKDNGAKYGEGGCSIGCTKAHFCGDGHADTDRSEECDLGDRNGQKLDSQQQPASDPNDPTAQIYCKVDCTIPTGIVY